MIYSGVDTGFHKSELLLCKTMWKCFSPLVHLTTCTSDRAGAFSLRQYTPTAMCVCEESGDNRDFQGNMPGLREKS